MKPRLAFISPLFLFPNDAGGKIRTTNILRGLKGGAFDVTLVGPATPEQEARWAREIDSICNQFVGWRPAVFRPRWRRAFDLLGKLPVNVAADRTEPAIEAVREIATRGDVDLMVFDFVHSAVLRPAELRCPSVCFTHNVEAEIFARHAKQASGPLRRWLWSSQYAKMRRFEREALARFTAVIAVSERDARFFANAYNVARAFAIPTGVDLDFFTWSESPAVNTVTPPTVVFTGSMDWGANIDGVQFFLDQVWPKVLARRPEARFLAVGRNPPASLRAMAKNARNVEFTGFVDDVRPYVRAAHVFVIPLLVGGGTRIKAFEAMAMGTPIVSTSIGMEGLTAEQDTHYLQRDDPDTMAAGVIDLLGDDALRRSLSQRARALVEERFGHAIAARVFEQICQRALTLHAEPPVESAR